MSGDDKCVTLPEIDELIRARLNGGLQVKSKRDWPTIVFQVIGVSLTAAVLTVGAGSYVIRSEVSDATTAVATDVAKSTKEVSDATAKVSAALQVHSAAPWHQIAGDKHVETTKRLNSIDKALERQTTILERVERKVDRQ